MDQNECQDDVSWIQIITQLTVQTAMNHRMKHPVNLVTNVTGAISILLLTLFFFLLINTSSDVHGAESNTENLAAIWTVELVGKATTYELQSELGTFQIHRSNDIDYRERRVNGMKSLIMNWGYPSGEPFSLWLLRRPTGSDFREKNHLRVDLMVVAAELDTAQIAKEVYFDSRVESTRPELVPKEQGNVWDGIATKFRNFNTTFYLIEQREAMDGRVIVCDDSAEYCNLYGARVNETLWFNSIMIHKDEVANWKQYQHKARQLINKAIVNVRQ